ncbi:MAG: hypothetical protein A2X13_13625 [Bacteroidetes bacterium GWC2_33_15]|nr:MAG: hypothetical protein A2X10_08840 [Bacteroidetes bacterium GWA2_33_15]OFX50387.1 MAG: hypothetical protein A2X13_13625 [Bacteroidetes bacterium GWC2_33_15]OFX66695.1 MAG: hypothetical protein A2X15_08250 [Bacteroidetes bacterium GWB2_32_14]OFX69313.1 MAG: hypothetical protein A2X14_09180 [Bacteroidetes bacterium GWD2_33_33]HAN18629.1 peptidylprolyl isomerase [Bacteroidales bacterium]
MKITNLLLTVFAFAIIATSCGQQVPSKVNLKTDKDTVSYIIGVDIANSLKSAKFEGLEYDAFIKGLDDVFSDKETAFSKDTIKIMLNKYFTELRNKAMEKNLTDGRAFLEENKKREGVITTASGLQYEIITEGTGKTPTATDMVKVNYRGTLIDGTEFDSSYERNKPAEFRLNGVITGWTEGLQLMKEGAKFKFYIPTELGYGTRVRPGGKLEANMALIFEVELLEVMDVPAEEPKNVSLNQKKTNKSK